MAWRTSYPGRQFVGDPCRRTTGRLIGFRTSILAVGVVGLIPAIPLLGIHVLAMEEGGRYREFLDGVLRSGQKGAQD